MTDVSANFSISNQSLNAGFTLSENTSFDALFAINAEGAVWGEIDGNIENQTDLKNALDGLQDDIDDHIADTDNPHEVTKEQIGVTKTSDVTNDGDGTSPFATQSYVDTHGGKIDKIQKNGTDLPITNKTVNITVPTKISDLTDDTSTNPVDKADTLTDLTATVTELNYVDGVTSNIQTQLGNKANISDIPTKVSDLENDSEYQTSSEVSSSISTHNSSTTAHNDIRQAIEALDDIEVGTIQKTTTNFVAGTIYSITNAIQRIANLFQGYKEDYIVPIQNKIPNEASSSNQLADKSFVNSSIQASAADFCGNFATWEDVPTQASGYLTIPSTNDYITVTDSTGYEASKTGTWRFKYTGEWETLGKSGWSIEYRIGNAFTSAQMNAINSGATTALISKITTNEEAIGDLQTDKRDNIYESSKIYGTSSTGTQVAYSAGNNISFDNNKITSKTKMFAITEDIVTVTKSEEYGVSPYSSSYKYTNIEINADAGIEWVEGALYTFIISSSMVVASAYRNVRVRIGADGDWKPIMSSSSTIASGSTYFTKAYTTIYQYKTTYQENGGLHVQTDNNSTYEQLRNTVPTGAVQIDDAGYGARYSLMFPTTALNVTDERFSSLVSSSATASTKTALTNLTFYADRNPQYVYSASIPAGEASDNATYQYYTTFDLRYTANASSTYANSKDKVFLWLKDFNPSNMTFKADATVGNVFSLNKIATRFPSSTTGDVYIYFIGWSGTTWYTISPNITQENKIFKYTPSTGAMVEFKIDELGKKQDAGNYAETDKENTFTKGQVISRTDAGAILKLTSPAGDTNFILERQGGSQCVLESGASVGLFGTKSNHPLQVRTNYTNRMTIGTDGSVKLATAPDSTSNDNQVATTKWVNDKGYITSSYHDDTKQDTLTAGSNITISNNTISATDTTYSASTGLTLNGTTLSVDDNVFRNVATGSKSWIEHKCSGGQSLTKASATSLGFDTSVGDAGTSIGRYASSADSAVAIGYNSTASSFATSVGRVSNAYDDGTAIGYNAHAYGSYGTAIGNNSTTLGQYGIALGYGATLTSSNCATAIGKHAKAEGDLSIAIGSSPTWSSEHGAKATGYESVAIGSLAQVTNNYSIQIGSGTNNNYSTLQFRSYPTMNLSTGKLYEERMPFGVQYATTLPFNLYIADENKMYGMMYTGETNVVYTQKQCYVSKNLWGNSTSHCNWVNSDFVQDGNEDRVMVNQEVLYQKMIDWGYSGGDNTEQCLYFYYDADNDSWRVQLDCDTVEEHTSGQELTDIDLAEFGISYTGITLPTEGEEEMFDVSYYAPFYFDTYDYNSDSFTLNYQRFISAMKDGDWGFGEVEKEGVSYPNISDEGSTIRFEYDDSGPGTWDEYIDGEYINYSWETPEMASEFGITIEQGTELDIEYIEITMYPSTRRYWVASNPVPEGTYATQTQLTDAVSALNNKIFPCTYVQSNNVGNLNNYTTDGIYIIPHSGTAYSTSQNFPNSCTSAILIVRTENEDTTNPDNTRRTQIIWIKPMGSGENPIQYTRYYHYSWQSWQKVLDTNSIKTITGYSASVAQTLTHDASGNLQWVNS